MASASRATVFSVPPDKLNFPRNEDEIQAYWDKIDAFKESLRRSEGRKLWTFYDGPPFATGLPHYGHILAGTIKDIVCRYAHQTGHHVERRAGWDCHGLPVEFEIDQKLGIKSRDDVLAMGIGNYNDECRAIVMRYSSQWVSTVTRMGRWIDFENDYKTMNISFMESVWWVFKQIFDKGLVYQGFKVMPYSTACSTPLSNFEASQNYKDVSDPALYVGFPLVGDPDGAMLVAWTTTPWTLPSNLALCVHPDFPYARVRDHASGKVLVMTTGRLAAFYSPAKLKKNGGKPLYTLLSECTGASLKGQAYEPCFDYFKTETRGFRVLVDKFVKDDSGTGIVHMAPAFGEEDNRICREAGLVAKDGAGIVCPLDANGRFTAEVRDFAGMYIKDADGPIAEALKARGLLVEKEVYNHSYPFCWRSETPLIYRTIPSWFVNVESIKERLLAANAQTYWVPEFVQTKRFHNWLKDARDWAISRNRFWGTPLPIWTSADGEEVVVVGSIAELQALSGRADVTDLHRQYIDEITIPSKQGKGLLRRVDEVFDCWFESGAMPYAQHHYPFENKAKFEAAFPADFIAEGLDQTRGWFYTLMVLSTALFDKPPFKNLIVNGLVLAEDGLKMSKRLKNYPDPLHVIHEYGADALRLYLINSPVVCAETLKFKEAGVKGIVRDVFLPWFNSFRFFLQAASRLELDVGSALGAFVPDAARALASPNVMDRWIFAAAHSLVAFVRCEMEAYRLYTTVPRILSFVEQLTNWYIKLNRTRLQRKEGDSSVADCHAALCTLYEVLLLVAKLMAPLTPFLAEYFYLHLAQALPAAQREPSVHFCMIPDVLEAARDESIERAVALMQPVIELGRSIRQRRNRPLKVPLPELLVFHRDAQALADIARLDAYIVQELKVRVVTVRRFIDSADMVSLKALPNHLLLGKRFGKAYGRWQALIKALSHAQLCAFLEAKTIEIEGEVFGAEELLVQSEFVGSSEVYESATTDLKDMLVVVNCVPDAAMLAEGVARNVSNRVQKLRKESTLLVQDHVEVFYQVLSPADAAARLAAHGGSHKRADDGADGDAATADECAALAEVVARTAPLIAKLIGKPFLPLGRKLADAVELVRGVREVDGVSIEFVIARELAVVDARAAGGEATPLLQQLLASYEPAQLRRVAADGGKLSVCVDGVRHELDLATAIAALQPTEAAA